MFVAQRTSDRKILALTLKPARDPLHFPKFLLVLLSCSLGQSVIVVVGRTHSSRC